MAEETVQNIQEVQAEATENVSRLQKYLNTHMDGYITFGVQVILAILIFIIGRKVVKLIRRMTRKSLEMRAVDTGIITFVDSLLRTVLYFLLIYIIALMFGFDTTSVAALLASAGVAIGLAVQGSLSNFAGGFLILVLKPFKVGDYIIEDTNQKEGVVQKIQIFYTELKTIDNKTIVIPNGMLTNNSLTNVTAQNKRMLDLRITISYESNLKLAKKYLLELLEKDPSVLVDEDIAVFVDDLGDHAVVLGARAWVKTEEYLSAKWRILEEVKECFDEKGIDIPYQQLVVHSVNN